MTNIYFAKNELDINTDSFFTSETTTYSNFVIDSIRDHMSLRTSEQEEILLVNLLSSKRKQIMTITYMSAMEAFASVGALSNIFIVLFTIIGNYINHYFFQNDLIKVFSNEERKVGRVLFINKRSDNNLKGITFNNNNTKSAILNEKNHNKKLPKMCFSSRQVIFIGFYDFVSYITCGKIIHSRLKQQYKKISCELSGSS